MRASPTPSHSDLGLDPAFSANPYHTILCLSISLSIYIYTYKCIAYTWATSFATKKAQSKNNLNTAGERDSTPEPLKLKRAQSARGSTVVCTALLSRIMFF